MIRRVTAVAAAGLATLGLLTACKSADPQLGPENTPGGSAVSTAVPSQDVTAGVTLDTALRRSLPAPLRSAGVLRVGTTLLPGTSGLPYSGVVGGRAVGLQPDLTRAVATLLGLRVRFDNATFDTILPGVQNGRYDVGVANFAVTREREQVVDFATYLDDGQGVLAARSAHVAHARSLTDLCGLRIATSPGTTFQQLLAAGAGRCAEQGRRPYTVALYNDSGPIFLGLQNGKLDAFFGPTLSLRYDATHLPGVRFLGQLSATPVGFVTGKATPLATVLQAAVNRLIADGAYARILAKWGVTSSGIPHSQLNPAPGL